MSTLSLRMKDENDKHEKIEAVGKRDMGVLLLSLLAKKEAGLERESLTENPRRTWVNRRSEILFAKIIVSLWQHKSFMT